MVMWLVVGYILTAVGLWLVATATHEPDTIWDTAADRLMDRTFYAVGYGILSAAWPVVAVVWLVRRWLRHTDVGGLWSRTHTKGDKHAGHH